MNSKQLKTILYVDDEADIREIVKMALGVSGNLEVYTCESGAQALTLLLQLKPDLVLLDVMMSGMDGLTTLRQMRENPDLAHIPVAFMTAKAMPQEVDRFRRLGAVGVIAKPFNPMRLSQQVFALWEQAPEQQAEVDPFPKQERLNELGKQFLHRSLRDVASLHSLLVRAQAGEFNAFGEFEQVAHRIRGAGASLGFVAISDCAGEIEKQVEDHTLEGKSLDTTYFERLTRTTGRLAGIVENLIKLSVRSGAQR